VNDVTRFCTRCGYPYASGEWRCPDCGNPEFGLLPDWLTISWLERNKYELQFVLVKLDDVKKVK
jgi:hypothetical protein